MASRWKAIASGNKHQPEVPATEVGVALPLFALRADLSAILPAATLAPLRLGVANPDYGLAGPVREGYHHGWNPLWISRDLCGARYGNLCVDPTIVSKEVRSDRPRVYPLRFASPAQHNPVHRLPPESLGFRTSVPDRHSRRFLLFHSPPQAGAIIPRRMSDRIRPRWARARWCESGWFSSCISPESTRPLRQPCRPAKRQAV